jgi:N-acetylneuraminate synthase/N,N'-diacetyllegionaminate synthase
MLTDRAACFMVAEIGINHNGDYGLAVEMIHAAAEAGADSVKFQNFQTEDFLSDRTLLYSYIDKGRTITEPLWDICRRSELNRDWIPKLKELSDRLGVIFFSTPTSERGVDDLMQVGVRILKNGSDYLTHTPLLKYMGTTGSTVVVSTGMAVKGDVDRAVAAVRSGGKSPLVLLHCTSSYPTQAGDVNLRRMVSLGEIYRVPVGFSDHTQGWEAAVQAVSLGACMVEKHFTIDHDLPGPDHWFSCTPDEFRRLVEEVRLAETRLGKADIGPAESELTIRGEFRIGLVAACALRAGQRLTTKDIAFRKPALGILPYEAERYIGQMLIKDVPPGECLKPEHFGVSRIGEASA